MRELPSGTVTFVFTDIDGSTRLLGELGEGYADALAEHRRVLRSAFASYGGVEVDTQGDACFYAFGRASDAVQAVAEAQTSLASGPVRVRIGMHTGEATVTDEEYVGLDVHAGARICAAANGGQVVLSERTVQLAGAQATRDLGLHRLKDFSELQRLFQLGDETFAPLRTLHQTNLPTAPTPFLGRTHEVSEVVQILRAGTRVVTLTGPGGSGKSRLAHAVAAELSDEYEHGVWWVSLATLQDPGLVLDMTASTLGAQGDLVSHLANKRLLLVLDNLEHLLEAGSDVAELSAACPRLVVITTSRQRLQIAAEREYVVPPLSDSEAVALFLNRSWHPDNGNVVLEICRRVGRLPLAIELAAARTKALSTTEILRRLQHRDLPLTGGPRDAPPRQRTMTATLQWSYDLLSADERMFFRRLSVFTGGFTLKAAHAVCDADAEIVASLIDKSLLGRNGERYRMLDPIREYARGQLDVSGQAESIDQRHAQHYYELVTGTDTTSAGQPSFFERIEAELGNLRTALMWLSASGEPDQELHLAVTLSEYWRARGPIWEGRRRLEHALGRAPPADARLRTMALGWLTTFARRQGDLLAARRYAEQQLVLLEASDDAAELAHGLTDIAVVLIEDNDLQPARPLLERAADLSRLGGDPSRPLLNLGMLELLDGRPRRAEELLAESASVARQFPEQLSVLGFALIGLGAALRDQHRDQDAVASLSEGLLIHASLGSREGVADALDDLAPIVAGRGDPGSAAMMLGAAEALREEIGMTLAPVTTTWRQGITGRIRSGMDDKTYDARWEQGRALEFDEVVDHVDAWVRSYAGDVVHRRHVGE